MENGDDSTSAAHGELPRNVVNLQALEGLVALGDVVGDKVGVGGVGVEDELW